MAADNKEVLFSITEDNLDTGLRGYPIGYCTTSSVSATEGLSYVGHPIEKVVSWSPEAVIYLLYQGKEGSSSEIAQFTADLRRRSVCSPELLTHIKALPRQGHPMKILCAALLLCGMIEGKNDYREDCLNLIAKIPQVVATVINHHAGWGSLKPSDPALGYMENFAHMVNVPNVDVVELTKVFQLFNILHYDHGGGNLSTFVGKAVASGLEDMYGSISAAMCALAGPKHGRANQDCLEFVQLILNELGANATEAKMEELLRRRLANNELIFGFGHAVLRVEDHRASVLYEKAKRKYPNDPLIKIASLLRVVAPKILSENPKISDPHANVDAISGALLAAAGFNYPDYFTVMFALSRVVGISIQIVYERCEARDGKGTPIVRPKYMYKPRK